MHFYHQEGNYIVMHSLFRKLLILTRSVQYIISIDTIIFTITNINIPILLLLTILLLLLILLILYTSLLQSKSVLDSVFIFILFTLIS